MWVPKNLHKSLRTGKNAAFLKSLRPGYADRHTQSLDRPYEAEGQDVTKKEVNRPRIWPIILQHWVPPTITAALGLLTGLYVASTGQVSAEKQLYLKHRIGHAEAVAIHFSEYVENWRRLIQVSTYEREKGVLDHETAARKNAYVTARNNARDKLFGALGALELYFGPQVLEKAAEFRKWDDAQTIKRLNELPPLSEWRNHSAAIVGAIRAEMEGKS